ncbi:lactate racemase domain-containing protein [Paenibacillus sp. LHD-117]|uniref:lactate racemase domain-containing protein n=1 Tax=Paenibacillus sp. LHD-117 TaxID=3071412 RepID=UPI0027DF87D7|nr:lactate racemase domain-containing protein [Paenibacillus sp. LHD-117]MDQ6421547.1 lactate racemase domain-containing protein [Paenibacillus sp. LHD-117]
MSELLTRLVEQTPIPSMYRIRQRFDGTVLDDPIAELKNGLKASPQLQALAPGAKVALAVGSRGISRIDELTKAVVDELKLQGCEPFIVPCMGSHGGATDEGQAAVLAHLGIDEKTMGCPVRSSMEVVELDKLPNGLPVYCDKISAEEADAIVVINRIKPHTAFRGPIESGLFKMIAIGLGKQKGAEACHQLGFKYMAENVPAMARIMIDKLPIAFGVAVVENAYDQICRVEVLGTDTMEERERELLVEAKSRLPKFLFDSFDVLVVDYIGKNISGDGMDPNITGRYPTPYASGGPEVNKIVVLDLTKESKGNANGVGTADFTTSRLVGKTDWPGTYANGLTSTVCAPTKQATTLANDKDAIKAGIKTSNILDYATVRLARIRDTLHLGEIEISETLLEEAKKHPDIEVLEGPFQWQFDEEGFLAK